jgi:hypothetical protein
MSTNELIPQAMIRSYVNWKWASGLVWASAVGVLVFYSLYALFTGNKSQMAFDLSIGVFVFLAVVAGVVTFWYERKAMECRRLVIAIPVVTLAEIFDRCERNQSAFSEMEIYVVTQLLAQWRTLFLSLHMDWMIPKIISVQESMIYLTEREKVSVFHDEIVDLIDYMKVSI